MAVMRWWTARKNQAGVPAETATAMATAYIETTVPSYCVARTSDSLLHIANPFIRDRLRSAVASAGFELPEMCSPEEPFQKHDEDD